MSAPADTGSASLASTPAPSASSSALAGSPPASSSSNGTSAASEGSRPRVDPHTTWEEFRARQSGAKVEEHVDTPQLTPDKLSAWLAEHRSEDAEEGEADKPDAPAKAAAPEPAKTPEPAPEAPKPPRTFKVRVKGEDIALPLDKYAALVKLSPETVEYIAEHEGEQSAAQLYQRLHRGDEDARQHGNMRREMERMFAGLKSSPLEILEYLAKRDDVGFDLLDVGYQIVQRDIDTKALTPEARRLREVEGQLAQMQARERQAEAERTRVLQEAHQHAERTRVETFRREMGEEIAGALADAKLPSDDYHKGLVEAALIGDMHAKGSAYAPPQGRAEMRARAAAHVPAVREQLKAALKALYATPDAETVKAFTADHPELHAASAKQRVAEYKKNSAAQGGANGADNRGTATTPRISEQWRDDLRRRA